MRSDLNNACLHCGRPFLLAPSALRCRLNAVAAGFVKQQAEKRAAYAAQRAGRRQVVWLYVVTNADATRRVF